MDDSRDIRSEKSGGFGYSTKVRSRMRDPIGMDSRKSARGGNRSIILVEQDTKRKDKKEELAKERYNDAFVSFVSKLMLTHNAFENGSSKWYSITKSNKSRLLAITEKFETIKSIVGSSERQYNKVCGAGGTAFDKKRAKVVAEMEKGGAKKSEIKRAENEITTQKCRVYNENRDNIIALYDKYTVELNKMTEQLSKMEKS